MKLNVTQVNAIDRACVVVAELIDLSQPRGPLCDLPRKRVSQVSRTAKWLQRALGELIHDNPQLMGLLAEYAVKPPPTDEELDEIAKKRLGDEA